MAGNEIVSGRQVALAGGWLLTLGSRQPRRGAVMLPTAMRDFAMAAGIAASAFGIAAAALLGIYGVMVLVFGAIVVNTSRRR